MYIELLPKAKLIQFARKTGIGEITNISDISYCVGGSAVPTPFVQVTAKNKRNIESSFLFDDYGLVDVVFSGYHLANSQTELDTVFACPELENITMEFVSTMAETFGDNYCDIATKKRRFQISKLTDKIQDNYTIEKLLYTGYFNLDPYAPDACLMHDDYEQRLQSLQSELGKDKFHLSYLIRVLEHINRCSQKDKFSVIYDESATSARKRAESYKASKKIQTLLRAKNLSPYHKTRLGPRTKKHTLPDLEIEQDPDQSENV